MINQHPRWMSEDHVMFQDMVRKFFEAELRPNLEQWHKSGLVDRQFWCKSGEVGLLGAAIPEAYGGSGGTLSMDAVVIYEQGYFGDASWGFSVQNIVQHYILDYGTDTQKERWLPKLVSGDWIGAIAMTEPGTGSDLQSIKTHAAQVDDGYVLNGQKTFITNGQTADLVIVVAKTSRNKGSGAISLIGVETAHAEGFQRGRNLEKLGMKGQDTSELFFDNVRVPADNLLGGIEGKGFAQLMSQLTWERLLIGIMSLGYCDAILNETLAYVKDRKAFNQRLMDFQNTRFKLAEAKTKLEVTRSFINDCVERFEAGDLDAATASMAKWWSTEIQCQLADECLQLFGGYGYMLEYPITRFYADSRVQKIVGGTNEIQKELIARSLDA